MAGGVSSPVRAFKSVGGEPVFMARGSGPHLFDNHGKKYVDYCLSWGAVLLGHADRRTVSAVQKQAPKGTGFGTVTEAETALAVEIKKAFPGMEKIRFTSSGTEAVMSAIRLARGVTGRNRIVKFEGCYHGHADGLLVKAGSGLATFGAPDSEGVPKRIAELTTVLPYNDTPALERFFKKAKDVACVIVEPVAGNMGVIPGRGDFLKALRKKTAQNGALLIFDEVITGFRLCYGGAQHLHHIRPDITVLGKIIGGGLPIGAFGARAALMKELSPTGKVYQAGTLSGNPLSMAAGLGVLSGLSCRFYERLNRRSELFLKETQRLFKRRGRPVAVQGIGSMFTLFFRPSPPRNFREALQSNRKEFARFFHRALEAGLYFPPSAFEACFISASHGEPELENTLRRLKKC